MDDESDTDSVTKRLKKARKERKLSNQKKKNLLGRNVKSKSSDSMERLIPFRVSYILTCFYVFSLHILNNLILIIYIIIMFTGKF